MILLLCGGHYCFSQMNTGELPDALIADFKKLNKNDTNAVHLMHRISTAYTKQSIYNDSCRIWADAALELSIANKYPKGIADSYYQIGRTRIAKSEYSQAIESFYQAFSHYTKLNDSKGIADIYLQVGVIMYNQKNYEDAISNFNSSIDYYKTIQDSFRISMLNYLIGLSNVSLNKNESAVPYLVDALRMKNSIRDSQGIAECQMAMGNLYLNFKRYDLSKEYYKKCYTNFLKAENKEGIVVSLIGLGKNAVKENQLSLAENFFNDAYTISLQLNRKSRVISSTEELFGFYNLIGNYEKAYKFQDEYRILQDSVYSLENTRAIEVLRSRIEAQKKQSELEAMLRRQQTEQIISISLFGFALLIMALAYNLYRKYKFKNDSEKKLAKSNEEINHALVNLQSAEQQLIQTEKMASLGRLTAGIAHELRNPMNFVSNFAQSSVELTDEYLSAKDSKEEQELATELKENLSRINKHSKRADRIIKSMLLHSRAGEEEVRTIDLNLFCNEFLELAYNGMRSSTPGFECNLFKNMDTALPKVEVVPNDIIRILLNFLNNAFYAVNEKKQNHKDDYIPVVIISTSKEKNMVRVSVKDNGTGIPKQYHDKIFTPFFTTKPQGNGLGLGLSICSDIVKNYNGEMIFNTLEGEGTVFSFLLPVPDAVS